MTPHQEAAGPAPEPGLGNSGEDRSAGKNRQHDLKPQGPAVDPRHLREQAEDLV
jgi:hypothetical protein